MNDALLEEATAFVKGQWPEARPTGGLILGSGWSEVVEAFDVRASLSYGDIPGLGNASVVGHAGRLAWADGPGGELFLFQGRRHYYEGAGWTPVAIPVYLIRQFEARTLLVTNAAGGVRGDLHPGDLMIITDHINLMGSNPLLGEHQAVWGPRFPDQSQLYDPALQQLLRQAGASAGVPLSAGVYLAASGPTYETPAEVRAFQALGADAVGMSTVPEAMLANAAGLRVAGLSCITNLAAGLSPTPLTHEEVTDTTRSAMSQMKRLLSAFWEEMSHAPEST